MQSSAPGSLRANSTCPISVNQARACSAQVLIIEQFGKWKDSKLKRVLG